MGLCSVPIFALGGGIDYLAEFGFGYILAYLPAAFLAGSFLDEEFSFKNILKATFVGVMTIHFIGIIYMLMVVIFKHQGWAFIKGWILAQSVLKIAYDLVLSFMALVFAKYGSKFVKYLIG